MDRTRPSTTKAGGASKSAHEVEAAPSSLQKPSVPGTEPWVGGSKLVSGGSLSDMSKYNENDAQFSHLVDIRHDDAFTLRPLTITDGPLKGRRVLVLDEVKPFRLMDLPPEIRAIVLSLLLDEHDHISLVRCKPVNKERRMVRLHHTDPRIHQELTWDAKSAKWIGQPLSAHALIGVSKQMRNEAAAIAYGNNCFKFDDTTDLKLFLTKIGHMREFIRHIALNQHSWNKSGPAALSLLKLTTALRTLSVDHSILCGDALMTLARDEQRTKTQGFVTAIIGLLKALNRPRKGRKGSAANVLELIEVTHQWCARCARCSSPQPDGCWNAVCGLICAADSAAHCEEVKKKLRRVLAKELGIKESGSL